jgi:hypothetical protein
MVNRAGRWEIDDDDQRFELISLDWLRQIIFEESTTGLGWMVRVRILGAEFYQWHKKMFPLQNYSCAIIAATSKKPTEGTATVLATEQFRGMHHDERSSKPR